MGCDWDYMIFLALQPTIHLTLWIAQGPGGAVDSSRDTIKAVRLVVSIFFSYFQINESSLKLIPVPSSSSIGSDNNRRQPVITHSGLELEIDSSMYEGGRAKVQCVATLFNLYKKRVELVLEEEKPRPRPSSELRTRDASGKDGSRANVVIFPH